jgi:CRP-like cAMP-binding protein
MAKVDLRKVKDQATQAGEKKQYARAAELYLQIAVHEPNDPDWHQRAGEALRKVPDPAGAIVELGLAAEGYARGGFLLKAIAVCKVILQLDPRHTATQATLADLYAKREGDGGRRGALSVTHELGRGLLPPTPIVPRPTPSVPRAAEPPPSGPLDALPLRTLLGGRLSQQFAAVSPETPSAYEIALDDDMELQETIDVPAPPGSPTAAPRPLPPPSDAEIDFGDLLADRPPSPPPPTMAPPLPRIPLLSSLGADDLRQVIERVEVRDYASGERILQEGDRGGSLFVIVHGRVQILVEQPHRDLAQLADGAFFGELALLTNFPRSATAVALLPTQLLEISRELVGDIVRRSPEVLKTLLRFFRDRLLDRLLGSSPLFSSFAPDEARKLSDQFLFLELEPGMRLIVEGERAPGLFVLLCGEARVVRGAVELARLGPGDVCGEMSLLTRAPASATIETRTKCWALELPREHFQEVVLGYPQMLEYVSDVAERRKQENLRVDFF